MVPKDDATPILAAREQLRAAIAAAEKEVSDAKSDVDVAKLHYDVSTLNLKSLRKALHLVSKENDDTRLSKETVHPYVVRILAKGSLAQAELSTRLCDELRNDGISPSGIALVLRPLAKEFKQGDGTWALQDAS